MRCVVPIPFLDRASSSGQQKKKRLSLEQLDNELRSFEVFVNNTTLTMLTYLTYLSTLCFNPGEIISYVWGTLVFYYVIINQYI